MGLVEREREDVVLAEELDQVPRELRARVDLGRAGRDLLARQGADEVAQLALLDGQGVPGHGPGFYGPIHTRSVAWIGTKTERARRASPSRR